MKSDHLQGTNAYASSTSDLTSHVQGAPMATGLSANHGSRRLLWKAAHVLGHRKERFLAAESQTAVCTRAFECLGTSRRARPAQSTESCGSVGEFQENAKVCRRCMRVRCG